MFLHENWEFRWNAREIPEYLTKRYPLYAQLLMVRVEQGQLE